MSGLNVLERKQDFDDVSLTGTEDNGRRQHRHGVGEGVPPQQDQRGTEAFTHRRRLHLCQTFPRRFSHRLALGLPHIQPGPLLGHRAVFL